MKRGSALPYSVFTPALTCGMFPSTGDHSMLLPMLLLLADVDDLLSKGRTMTAPERGCARAEGAEVAVCGRRAADRFRVPFTGYDPGDRRGEGVGAERERLLAKTNACQDRRAIMVDCGFAGVRVSTNGNEGARLSGRTLAP